MKQSNTAVIEENQPVYSYNKYSYEKSSNDLDGQRIYSFPFNYDEASDEALVSLYVNNSDERAFNKIIERYNEIIIGFAMKLIKNIEEAEDVRQDVFLILVTKLQTFKGNSKFSTWLYRVTLNTCYKYLNQTTKKTHKEINLDESFLELPRHSSDWGKQPDEIALIQEGRELLDNAINQLTESNKEIFTLKDINGCSNAEVGEIMELSLSAVKSRVLRTRLALKEKISDYYERV